MKSDVFNNIIGAPFDWAYPNITKEQEADFLASFFEQILIFDRVTISTNRLNFALVFLISRLGINIVEQLFDRGYLKIMIWTPVIVTSTGRKLPDGTIDESVIYGQPPIVAGSLGDKDLDPEENIKQALQHFNLHRDRRRIFTRKASNHYIIPDGMEFSNDSAKLVIDSYENNVLGNLGLPFEAVPDQLDLEKRQILLGLGNRVLESAVMSKYSLKGYFSNEHKEIFKQQFLNIGNALNVSENTSQILRLENLPDLKSLFLQEKLKFDEVFKLRNISNAKYYRKWINEVSENYNAEEIAKEYLNEIKGSNKFFASNEGKLIRNVGMFGVGTGLGAVLAGPIGAIAGFGLGLLDTFLLDNLLLGKNPSMFIEDIRNEIKIKE